MGIFRPDGSRTVWQCCQRCLFARASSGRSVKVAYQWNQLNKAIVVLMLQTKTMPGFGISIASNLILEGAKERCS